MQNLLPGNVSWFAEYFCDLLLQIGTVPMQEMDRDILKHVGDKDRLQVREEDRFFDTVLYLFVSSCVRVDLLFTPPLCPYLLVSCYIIMYRNYTVASRRRLPKRIKVVNDWTKVRL